MVFAQKCHKNSSSFKLDTKLQCYVKVFENPSIGMRTWVISLEFGAQIGQKVGKGSKKEGIFGFPPIVLYSLDG